jgi:hypothetical protein
VGDSIGNRCAQGPRHVARSNLSTMVILDTDHISVLERREQPAVGRLLNWLANLPPSEVATTGSVTQRAARGTIAIYRLTKPASIPSFTRFHPHDKSRRPPEKTVSRVADSGICDGDCGVCGMEPHGERRGNRCGDRRGGWRRQRICHGRHSRRVADWRGRGGRLGRLDPLHIFNQAMSSVTQFVADGGSCDVSPGRTIRGNNV